jgi:site-specific DNA-cytosine methylase
MLKYLSTFTGIGGLEWGLEKTGAKCVGFSEIKESSVRIYSRHHPDAKNFGDITKIKPEDLPSFDILLSGFPCQSFSLAGARKGFADRRGKMIFYIYDILLAKKPKYAVLENVKGIMTHDGGRTVERVLKLLQAAGYSARIVLLNSAHYGSAQARERVFFLCQREKDFPAKNPLITDGSKRFRDIRDHEGVHQYVSEERVVSRIDSYLLVGGYDRVNTITTGVSSSGRKAIVVQEDDGRLRKLTVVEAERLQGFPEGWVAGENMRDAWFALGNAVNCNASEYLFTDYLNGVWEDFTSNNINKI